MERKADTNDYRKNMIRVALNLGGSNGPLNHFPMLFEFENIRGWTDSIREESNMLSFLDWAVAYGVFPIRKMKLWAYIEHDDRYWEFEVNLKNVREFKKYMDMDWGDIVSIVEAYRREKKIDEILD